MNSWRFYTFQNRRLRHVSQREMLTERTPEGSTLRSSRRNLRSGWSSKILPTRLPITLFVQRVLSTVRAERGFESCLFHDNIMNTLITCIIHVMIG